MFIALSSTCIQNFSNQHSAFVFFITFCGRCGMEWDTCGATYNLFWAFLSPGTREPLLHFDPPKQHFFSLGSWKKYNLSIHPKKDNHPSPYPEWHFCSSLQIWDELIVFGRLSRGFVVTSGASNLRLSWNCSRLGLLTIVRAILLSSLFYT